MVALVVLAALTGVRAGADGVHGQCEGLVSLLRQSAERHGTSDEVLDDVLDRFHLIYIYGVALEVEEVAEEDGFRLVVDQRLVFLEQVVVARARGQLQRSDGLRVPGMLDAVVAPMELSEVGQWNVAALLELLIGLVVEAHGVAGDGVESDTADGAHFGTEVGAEQALRQTDSLEDLCTAIGADGRDTHLGHNLEQALLDGRNVVGLGRGVVLLYLTFLDEVVENGVGHVRTECGCTVAQQQGGMHHLAYLSALHNQCGLHTLADIDEVVVDGTHRQQRRDGDVVVVDVAVGEDDVVVALIHALFCVVAEFGDGLTKGFARMLGATLGRFERDAQLLGVEALIADVLQNVELTVGQDGVGQTHHLTVGLVGIEDARAHATDVFGKTHHQLLADRVDGGVGDLSELLAEVVEENLRLRRQYGQRRIVTH